MNANLDDPGKFEILLLIEDPEIMAGVQVQPKMTKHYPLYSSESFRIKLVG